MRRFEKKEKTTIKFWVIFQEECIVRIRYGNNEKVLKEQEKQFNHQDDACCEVEKLITNKLLSGYLECILDKNGIPTGKMKKIESIFAEPLVPKPPKEYRNRLILLPQPKFPIKGRDYKRHTLNKRSDFKEFKRAMLMFFSALNGDHAMLRSQAPYESLYLVTPEALSFWFQEKDFFVMKVKHLEYWEKIRKLKEKIESHKLKRENNIAKKQKTKKESKKIQQKLAAACHLEIMPAFMERKAKVKKVLEAYSTNNRQLAKELLKNAVDQSWLFLELLDGFKVEADKIILPKKILSTMNLRKHGLNSILVLFEIISYLPDSLKHQDHFLVQKFPEIYLNLELLDLEWFGEILCKFPDLQFSNEINSCFSTKNITQLTEMVALVLASLNQSLYLNSITVLSVSAAKALTKITNPYARLNFSKLESLSVDAAQALSSFRGCLISINGIKTLDDDTALALSGCKCELSLNSLISLTNMPGNVSLAKTLSTKSECLDLSNLINLGHEAAKMFINHKGKLLLDGIKQVDDITAKMLGKCCCVLSMEGLEILDDSPGHLSLAKKLVRQNEDIRLNNLSHLGDKVAEVFSKHRKKIYLNKVTSLNDACAASLSKHPGDVELRNLACLSDSQSHIALASKLSKQGGQLVLSGLTALNHKVAEVLSKHDGELYLNGLTSLDDEAAKWLCKLNDNLYLNGLTSLSGAVAEMLSKHKYALFMDGLVSLCDEAAEALNKYEGNLSMDGLIFISEASAKAIDNQRDKYIENIK